MHISCTLFFYTCLKYYLNTTSLIGALNDMPKNVEQLVHTRHRSFHNFLMNLLAAMKLIVSSL